jgi:hypothetical protein
MHGYDQHSAQAAALLSWHTGTGPFKYEAQRRPLHRQPVNHDPPSAFINEYFRDAH